MLILLLVSRIVKPNYGSVSLVKTLGWDSLVDDQAFKYPIKMQRAVVSQ